MVINLNKDLTLKRNRKTGDWVLTYQIKGGKNSSTVFSNKAALNLADAILREQEDPTTRKKMHKLDRNKAGQTKAQAKQGAEEIEAIDWFKQVRDEVIDMTHALIIAKERGLQICSREGHMYLTPQEAADLDHGIIYLR